MKFKIFTFLIVLITSTSGFNLTQMANERERQAREYLTMLHAFCVREVQPENTLVLICEHTTKEPATEPTTTESYRTTSRYAGTTSYIWGTSTSGMSATYTSQTSPAIRTTTYFINFIKNRIAARTKGGHT